VLAGELHAETIAGFAHPAPLALLKHGIRGKTVVYSTTNGTVAMTQAAGAARVYCGALLNARRLAEHIVARHPRETVLLVCSGSGTISISRISTAPAISSSASPTCSA